ncbi:MAG TPA: hypothetical protein VF899_02675, partial [Pyrinomonadaceae bacterium]
EKEYEKQSAEYEAKYKGQNESPESKLAIANINQLVDRIIDALARAVAVAGTDAASQQSKAQWLARLTELYKFRHNQSDAGLTDLIASVMSKPLPPVPTRLTTLPVTTPATSNTPPTGSVSDTGSAPASAASTTTNNTPAGTSSLTTTSKTTTTPAATTSSTKAPAKPKKRNNHRRQ